MTTTVECPCGLVTARRLERIFGHAGIPARFADATFATYPSRWTRGVREVEAWSDGDHERSLLLYGPYGVGKTGLAIAALRARVEREHCAALFITTPQLLDRIRATYSGDPADSEAEVLLTVETVQLLVLDDLGAERVTDWQREKLFTVLNARHDALLPTIYTTNLPPPRLVGHLGERTVERLKEDCAWVEVVGPNLRDRED